MSPTSPLTTPIPSYARREEVRKLWADIGIRPVDLFGDAFSDAKGWWTDNETHVWAFLAALDAQSAERTRSEVARMREALEAAEIALRREETQYAREVLAKVRAALTSARSDPSPS